MSPSPTVIDRAKERIENQIARYRAEATRYAMWGAIVGIPLSLWIYHVWRKTNFIGPMSLLVLFAPLVLYFFVKNYVTNLFAGPMKDSLAALDRQPETAEDYAVRGWAFVEADLYEEAIDDYHKALEMEPENDDFLDELVIVLWTEMKDGDRALPYVERLCEIEGDNQADAFMLRGQILAETDPEAALKSFDRAIEIDPDDSDYPLARLRFFINTDQLDKAEEYLPEVEDVVKNEIKGGYVNPYWFEVQARLALKRGEAENALKFASQAIRLLPKDKELYEVRAEAYDALGQMDKADADRRKAEQLDEP